MGWLGIWFPDSLPRAVHHVHERWHASSLKHLHRWKDLTVEHIHVWIRLRGALAASILHSKAKRSFLHGFKNRKVNSIILLIGRKDRLIRSRNSIYDLQRAVWRFHVKIRGLHERGQHRWTRKDCFDVQRDFEHGIWLEHHKWATIVY